MPMQRKAIFWRTYQVWQKNLIKYNDVSDYQLIFTDEELETEQKNKVIRQGGRFCEWQKYRKLLTEDKSADYI